MLDGVQFPSCPLWSYVRPVSKEKQHMRRSLERLVGYARSRPVEAILTVVIVGGGVWIALALFLMVVSALSTIQYLIVALVALYVVNKFSKKGNKR